MFEKKNDRTTTSIQGASKLDRQHGAPILIDLEGRSKELNRLPQQGPQATILETEIQALVHAHPDALPISEIDPMFVGAVALCREMQLGQAGRVDNFLVTPNGLPVLVECKLWRNPQARREVIGQILDYAKVLSRWSFDDVQREVAAKTGGGKDALLARIRLADPSLDETRFIDSLTVNLRRGRFLLLILGDGIREDVETIASYLQAHAGLHFTFGLVEFPIFLLPNGARLIAPRVVARTTSIVRTVVAMPEGHAIEEPSETVSANDSTVDPERAALSDSQQAFWRDFIENCVRLDDQAQPIPRPPRLGYVSFMLPAPQGSSWIVVFRDMNKHEVGVFLSASQNSPGESAMRTVTAHWADLKDALAGTTHLAKDRYGRERIVDRRTVGDLTDPAVRKIAFEWLAERINTFINVLRPLIRDAVADEAAREG